MIFLNNVYITNEGNPFGSQGGSVYDRGNLPNQDKLDIYMYSLASMAKAYPWKKAIIYYKLHEEYHDREQELIDFIKKEFDGTDLILRGTRNEYVSDWINTYELLDDELIWFYCNHDHVYLDNTDYLANYVSMFRKNYSNTLSSIYFSHWPEMLCHVSSGTIEKVDDMDIFKHPSSDRICSIQIITKKLYKHWWLDDWGSHNTKNIFLPRSDHAQSINTFKKLKQFQIFVPAKEICRHFDGYGHTFPRMTNEHCPALSIPEGFFEKNIKICFEPKLDKNIDKGYTYLDCRAKHYYAHDFSGTDYKWTKSQIPNFWLDRITKYQGTCPSFNDNIGTTEANNLINLIFANARMHTRKFVSISNLLDPGDGETFVSWPDWIRDNILDLIMEVHGFLKDEKPNEQ